MVRKADVMYRYSRCAVVGGVVMVGAVSVVRGGTTMTTTMSMVADGVWDGDNRMTLSIFVDSDYMLNGITATHVSDVRFLLEAIGENSTVEQISLLEEPGWGGVENITDEGYDGDGGYGGFEVEQVIFLPFIQPGEESALEDGPVFVVSFEILLSEPIDESTELGWQFGAYGVEESIWPQDTWFPIVLYDVYANPIAIPGESIYLDQSQVEMGSFYIPSPSGVMVLLGAGCIGARRRR